MLSFQTSSRAVAYASLNESQWDLGRLSFLKLRSYCEARFYPVEIVSEKGHPESRDRPLWSELIKRVKNKDVILIIVPSLFHIAGSDVARLSDFLRLLETHNVKLMALKGQIDSDRFTRSQILQIFVTTQFSLNPLKR